MPRSATSEAVAAAAVDLARRRHHAVAGAAHVLAVVFEFGGMARRVRRLGFDADHLRACIERTLDDLPEAGVYRDATPPAIDSVVDRILTRADPRVRAYGTAVLVSAFEEAPELRGALRPYVLDESVFQRVKDAAAGSDCSHALTLLLNDHFELATRLSDSVLDIEDLTKRSGIGWREILPDAVDAARREGEARLEPAVAVAYLVRAVAQAAGYEHDAIGGALDLVLHGPLPSQTSEAIADDAHAELVFFNDALTTQDAVQQILVDVFGMSETEAHDTMLAIDGRDEAVVATMEGARARDVAARSRAMARSFGHPLRVIARV